MAKTKKFHPLAQRIMDGEDVSFCEISQFNAEWIMRWVRDGGHPDCGKKDCVCRPTQNEVEYAARLASHEFCCGTVS